MRERRRGAWMVGWLAALAAIAGPGCVGHPNPGCTGPVGIDGRPLPVCDGAGEVPVCDLSAMADVRAHYERNELGAWVLEDGRLAYCDEVEAVVCPTPGVTPYCLYKPPS